MLQGGYRVVTGLWPIISMSTFELISGRKVDKWLVKTAGALIAVIGFVLYRSAEQPSDSTVVRELGLGTALCLAAVDVIYVYKRRISPVYLFDAFSELAFAVLWLRRGRS